MQLVHLVLHCLWGHQFLFKQNQQVSVWPLHEYQFKTFSLVTHHPLFAWAGTTSLFTGRTTCYRKADDNYKKHCYFYKSLHIWF